jgi:hypothetical protein
VCLTDPVLSLCHPASLIIIITVALQVHHFGDIGYRHNSYTNCPAVKRNNCDCDAAKSVDQHALPSSYGRCHGLWTRLMKEKLEAHHYSA